MFPRTGYFVPGCDGAGGSVIICSTSHYSSSWRQLLLCESPARVQNSDISPSTLQLIVRGQALCLPIFRRSVYAPPACVFLPAYILVYSSLKSKKKYRQEERVNNFSRENEQFQTIQEGLPRHEAVPGQPPRYKTNERCCGQKQICRLGLSIAVNSSSL